MNGAKLPNWVTFIIMGAMLGIQGAAVWFGQKAAVDKLVEVSEVQTNEIRGLTHEVTNLNGYLEETVTEANAQHRAMWEAIHKPENIRDLPTRQEWQNHQWEWQK